MSTSTRRANGLRAADIVVIEDDPDTRETLGYLLESWGYRVQLAADGREGLQLIVRQPPRAAVIDIAMPELDGYEVARRIHAELGDERPQLIALTAFSRPEDRDRAMEAGFDVHLTKPTRLSLLRDALEELAPEPRSKPH